MPLERKHLARLLGVDESEILEISGLRVTMAGPSDVTDFVGLIRERVRKRYDALVKVLVKEDDLGRVIRAHIYIEHELQDFIFFAAPHPDHLKPFEGLEFSDKVQLALLLGLNPDLRSALNTVGNLRNKFAHALDMKVREAEVRDLIATLRPMRKQRLQFLWRRDLSAAGIPVASVMTAKKSAFRAKTQLMEFFLVVFDCIAEERHRVAGEKHKRIVEQMSGGGSVTEP
jgi:hypothetical protein